MTKIVVVYSGGMDSFTLINLALYNEHKVSAISFDYGQKHKKELIIDQFKNDNLIFVEQKQLLGTADAIKSCLPELKDFNGNEILYGKTDFKNPSLILKGKYIS